MDFLPFLTEEVPVGGGIWFTVIYLVIIGGFMYLIIFRPQKKQQKAAQVLLSTLENGDSVLTSGGFYGVVIDIMDDVVIVEFGSNKNCRIPMKKTSIVDIEKPETQVKVEEKESKKESK